MRSKDTMMCFNAPSGYGKTTALNQLRMSLSTINTKNKLLCSGSKDFDEVILAATTAKAASLIKGAKTIHKTLGLYVWKDFKTGKSNLKERQIVLPNNCVVVVDESSMIDTDLMRYIEAHIRNGFNVKYIFVGDEAQLKSVGTNFSVFQLDLPTISLTQPMRQKEDSALFKACEALRSGVFGTSVKVGTSHDICRIDKAGLHAHLLTDLSETKIVTYTNKQAIRYNQLIRRLNGKPSGWSVGDYVVVRSFYEPDSLPLESLLEIYSMDLKVNIATVPCYSILFTNGVRAAVAIDPSIIPAAIRLAKADRDYDAVKKLQEHILDIRDAGAGTTHTAQGSSYDTVIVDLADIKKCRDVDTRNRLLYTAVSRARKQVYLV
jgi:hypothetical protein